ncbi:MAG: hypothetical protein AVDCRST_MAG38-2755, partial [uncultured Solirubrobacteraceae bacterium]
DRGRQGQAARGRERRGRRRGRNRRVVRHASAAAVRRRRLGAGRLGSALRRQRL